MSSNNSRNEKRSGRVDRMLQAYRKTDGYTDENDILSERPNGGPKWMNKHYLKPSHIKSLFTRKKAQFVVIEPQMYDFTSLLDLRSEMITGANGNDPNPKFGGSTWFYEDNGLAVSGSGADHWILVTPKFEEEFEKFVNRMMNNAPIKAKPKPKAKPKAKPKPKVPTPPRPRIPTPPRTKTPTPPRAKKRTQKQVLSNQLHNLMQVHGRVPAMGKPSLVKVMGELMKLMVVTQARLDTLKK